MDRLEKGAKRNQALIDYQERKKNRLRQITVKLPSKNSFQKKRFAQEQQVRNRLFRIAEDRRRKLNERHEYFLKIRNHYAQIKKADQLKAYRLKKKYKLEDKKQMDRMQRERENNKEKALQKSENWFKKIRHNIEKEMKKQRLLIEYDRKQQKNIERRDRRLQYIRERFIHQILMKKSQIIRSHYEQRTVDNLTQTIISEISLHSQSDNYNKYESLNRDDIQMVVKSCTDLEIALNDGNHNTMGILTNIKLILDRIAVNKIRELPRDPFVIECVRHEIFEIMRSIGWEMSDIIKRIFENQEKQSVEKYLGQKKTSFSADNSQESVDADKSEVTLKRRNSRNTIYYDRTVSFCIILHF